MERLFDRLLRGVLVLLFCQSLGGCLSLRIDKIVNDADVKPLPQEFAVGRTTLAEVLASYGAPGNIVEMKRHFALYYQKAFYWGAQLSLSIPLSDTLRASPEFDASNNLQRYDVAIFVFTPDGILSEMTYLKGTDQPFWSTYWE